MLPLLLSAALFGSMLSDAESIGQEYALEIAKKAPPPNQPVEQLLLDGASTWLSINLNTLAVPSGQTAAEFLNQDSVWQILQDLQITGLFLKNLKEGGSAQTSLAIDPKWGCQWPSWISNAQKKGIAWIGDLIGPATGVGADFDLATQKISNYPDLYHLLPIDAKDWNLLPSIPFGMTSANIPKMQLEVLYKRGYIPEQMNPYIKESAWNATGKIICADGQLRRWIYLKSKTDNPVLAWLTPSFATGRLLAGDALTSVYQYGQKILCIDAQLPDGAKDAASLWIRKLGAFTVQKNSGSIKQLQTFPSDLASDTLTRPALLHALITENAEALRLIYKLYLQNGISQKQLVHALEPFDQFACDWTEFLLNPKQTYRYNDEAITGAILRNRLLKEDILKLQGNDRSTLPMSTWGGYCALAFGVATPQDFEKQADLIQKAHLLLAFTYAMQPGVFSLSLEDLTGSLPGQDQKLDLLGANSNALYPSIPCQFQSSRSFSCQLKQIIAARKKSKIALGELISIIPTANQGALLLLHRLPNRSLQLLAVNFSRHAIQEQIELPAIQNTWAIDLMAAQTEEKPFDAGSFKLSLPPLSGKVLLFQSKYAQ